MATRNNTLDSYDYTEDAGNGLIYIKKNGNKKIFINNGTFKQHYGQL